MSESQKPTRINKVCLKNIALHNYYKPVTQKNNIFLRMKRNSAVLSQLHNYDQTKSQVSKSLQIAKHQSKHQSTPQKIIPNLTPIKYSRKSSLQSIKQNHSVRNESLPKISRTRQTRYFYENQQAVSKNQILGTQAGSLSTRQILKMYQMKRLREQAQKKEFLQNHIKNLKLDQYEHLDSDKQDDQMPEKKTIEKDIKSINKSSRESLYISLANQSQNPSKGSLNSTESEQRLLNLFQNRLTDRDYIDLNVKLFQKRDINKKKYFERYHNILKRQRSQLTGVQNIAK